MSLTRRITDEIIKSHRRNGWRADKESLFYPRRIDVLAISPGALEVIAFEVKVSSQDYRNEIKNPAKRKAVIDHCTQFYFVVPYGLINKDDVPPECGLIYFWWKSPEPSFYIEKEHPAKREKLTFELDNIARAQAIEQESDDAEGQWIADTFETSDWSIPRWMKSPGPRSISFQFDVSAIAAKISSVPTACVFNGDEVPF